MTDELRRERWRLVLGEPAADTLDAPLGADAAGMDRTLAALYDADRTGTLGRSSPAVARWLGDIRRYFPASVVRVMQQDAVDRLGLRRLLLEPELLGAQEPDVHLVATLLSLSELLPDETRETARHVVRRVVDDVQRRLRERIRQGVRGATARRARTRRPRPADIDWHRTIRANLRHWQPDRRVLVADHLLGHQRHARALHDVVLCVDQSGSMAASVVYAGIIGAVLASIPALTTRLVAFDTEVVDLTAHLVDPVDLLFGMHLGGGTDIGRALAYCAAQITRPARTTLFLLSDLYDGGEAGRAHREVAALVAAGVNVVCLLALSDDGKPAYDAGLAARLARLGVPAFGCTPDLFPELLVAAVERRDLSRWAAGHGLVVERGKAR